jgi:hypothetical protein
MTRAPITVLSAQIVAVIAAVLATMVLSACAAAPSSDGPVYVLDDTSATQAPTGTKMEWNDMDGILLMAAPAPADLSNLTPVTLPAPTAGANDCIAFLAPSGSERSKTWWKAWDDPVALEGKGVLLPAVWRGYLAKGNPRAVQAFGGTFNMCVAYMTDNVQTMVKAFFTTITVEAGTGTWMFATPPTAAATKSGSRQIDARHTLSRSI